MTVEWKDGVPVTTPEFVNGYFVFQTSAEDQRLIAAYNWRMIDLLAGELMKKRREGTAK